jgi:hypothetical protein
MNEIANSLGTAIDNEIKNDPVSVAETLNIFKAMGEGYRTEQKTKKLMKNKLMEAGYTEENANNALSGMNLGQTLGLKDLTQRVEDDNTRKQYSDSLNAMELQALKVYEGNLSVTVEQIHESIKLHDIMI